MTNEERAECYNQFKEDNINQDYKGENLIVQTKDTIFQLSTINDQKDDSNPDISSIELDECEAILKVKYNIPLNDQLIIIKTDIKNDYYISTYVQYEIFHPYTLEKLDMAFCNEVKIIVNSPTNLNEQTISLYNSLNNSGYNLFDINDPFYNDVCTTYTSENKTDVNIKDRQNEIFSNYGNITLCQSGCTFISYNDKTKKVKCNCNVQINNTETDTKKLVFGKEIWNTFLKSIKNSNFLILKCYESAFDFTQLSKNIGRIIMTIISIIFLIFLFIFLIKDRSNIDKYIILVIQNKNQNEVNKKNTFKGKLKEEKNKNKIIRIKNKNDNKKDKIKILAKKKTIRINEKKEPPRKTAKKMFVKKNKTINHNINDISGSELINKRNKNKKLSKGININIIPINNIINYNKKKTTTINYDSKDKLNKNVDNKIDENKKNKKKVMKNKDDINNIYLKDQELNNLKYEQALIYDKRSYLNYYMSLLKRNQLIIFTFIVFNDYNLVTIKFCLFLLSFSLYFTTNAFFFDDKTMHRIFIDNENYNLSYQIPQFFYSVLICSVINTILKVLSLTEQNILKIKTKNNLRNKFKNIKPYKDCIIIKFIVFYILSIIFLLFFLYFISCFCGIYINTQIILIKDSLISFGITMIYPFGLNLIPGIFRIASLRAKKKDKEWVYRFSRLLELLF